jgi:hypothetical protein
MTLAPSVFPQTWAIAKGAFSIREARLFPGAAHHSPWIEAGRWQPAAALADQVVAGRLLRGTHHLTRGRALPDAHFEFRGGTDRPRGAARPRREDR